MGAKPIATSDPGTVPNPASPHALQDLPARSGHWRRRMPSMVAALIFCGIASYSLFEHNRVAHVARAVRALTASGKIEEARGALNGWLEIQPRSAEAHYYQARLALAANEPAEAAQAIAQALDLGFDAKLLACLTAIIQARSNHFPEAEPILLRAYRDELEPQAEVAQELARGYLSTYRLNEATEPLERWRKLVPDDARPYMWRNEIESRSGGATATLIQNYRFALQRDPSLDRARLGLAEQLSVEGKWDEAEQEYNEYLKQKPKDASALVGLGRNALNKGEIETATRHFEDALQANPRQAEAHRELAQIDLRQRRNQKACERLRTLAEIEPFDQETRYAYAQALRLNGDDAGARAQTEIAAHLRADQEQILTLQKKILKDPQDLASRHQLACWMFEHGHAEEGLKWAQEILQANAHHVATHRLLADYYAKRGDAGLANYHRLMASNPRQ